MACRAGVGGVGRESPVSCGVRGPGPSPLTWIAPCAPPSSSRPPGPPLSSSASPVCRASGRPRSRLPRRTPTRPPASVSSWRTVPQPGAPPGRASRPTRRRSGTGSAWGLRGGVFRRERTLLDQARSARVLWTREGTDLVLWTGGEQRLPVAGLDTSVDTTYLREFAEDLAAGRTTHRHARSPGGDPLLREGRARGRPALPPPARRHGVRALHVLRRRHPHHLLRRGCGSRAARGSPGASPTRGTPAWWLPPSGSIWRPVRWCAPRCGPRVR